MRDCGSVAASSHSRKVLGSILFLLLVSAFILSGFLSQSENMHVRSIGNSRVSVGLWLLVFSIGWDPDEPELWK